MDGKINIKQILRKLTSRWYYFFVVLVVTFLLAYLYVRIAPRQYVIKASLLLRGVAQEDLGGTPLLNGMNRYASQTGIEDEIGILKSYSMIEKAIRELDFGVTYFTKENFVSTARYRDTPFIIEIDSVVNQLIDVPIYIEQISSTRYKVKVSGRNLDVYNFYTDQVENKVDRIEIDEEVALDKPFVHKYLSFNVKFDKAYKPEPDVKSFFVLNRVQEVTEKYQGKLSVGPISLGSYIVELSVKGRVAEKEKAFLNKLLEVYLKNELYKKNQLGLKTIQFIDRQLMGVSDTLREVEGQLALYRSRSNILDMNSTVESLNRNLAKTEKDKTALEGSLKYYNFIENALGHENWAEEVVASSAIGSSDPTINKLVLDLGQLVRERKTLNPNTIEGGSLADIIDSKMDVVKKSLAENLAKLKTSSTTTLTDLGNRIFQLKKNIGVLPRSERELVNIQRRVEFNDDIYNYLLQRRTAAGIAIASNSVDKTVIDKPYQVGSGPVSPNPTLLYTLAILGGIAIAIGLIVVKDVLNDNIISQEDVEQNTKIPFIGTISHANKREQGSIVAHARSPIGESFRSLRVNLQYLTLGKNANVIGITSSRESEGKTFCAVNLAAVMAYAGRRTILIDTDMRRPRVAEYFQLENRKGLSNFLVGDGTIQEIINNTEHKGFEVIGSGPIPPNPIDLIGNPRMEELINTLKQTYSTIILDSPPVGYVSEYIILMKYTDANLYIVRSDYTNRNSLAKINKLYERKKITNVSILLNDVKASKNTGYGYGYGYGYKF